MRKEYLNLRIIIYCIFISFISYGKINLSSDFFSESFSLSDLIELGSTASESKASMQSTSAELLQAIESASTVVITNPSSFSTFKAGDSITIDATIKVSSSAVPYLNIYCSDAEYRKLKIGYNAVNLYNPKNNVIVSGNNKVEIILKEVSANINWSKIQIRPQGNTGNPLVLGHYISDAELLSDGFKKITIPLNDFNSNIDFTQLTLIEFPYSTGAGIFEIQLQSIVFTGGTNSFVWFGNGKIDNKLDGEGASGKLSSFLLQLSEIAIEEGCHDVINDNKDEN